MNISNTPRPRIIVPFFMLLGLLTVITGSITACGSSQPRPVSFAEPEQTEDITTGEEVAAPAKKIRVKASYPKQYTVKKGDTLWGISNLYLLDPWYWPEIWQKNTQIQNPHLIFPGDVLTLVYLNGQPQILVNETQHTTVQQKADVLPVKKLELSTKDHGLPPARRLNLPVKKLSPGIRSKSLQASIPGIPGDAIRQFLSKPRIVTIEQLEKAPHIIASDEKHLILGSGDRIYIRGEMDKERVRFSVFRPGEELRDPVSDELLGYEAKYSGNVHITAYGDPATGNLTFTSREVLIGDRLLPEDKSKLENLFFPHIPDRKVNAQIISLHDALFGVAQFQIVVINKGERDGMEVGHLLATFTQGEVIHDLFNSNESVKLPDERSGLVMLFKTFDRVSYGLIMESKRVIHSNDAVHTPRF